MHSFILSSLILSVADGCVQREKIKIQRKMDINCLLIPPTFHSIHNGLRTENFKSCVPMS